MINKSFLLACTLTLGGMLLPIAGPAHATTLTFNSSADCSTSAVNITGGAGSEACVTTTGPAGSSALVRSTIPNVLDSFWTATFSSTASNVSIDLGDLGSDPDRLFLKAYDAANSLIGAVLLDITASDNTMHTLSLIVSGIKSITFGTIGAQFPGDPDGLGLGGIYADNLTYTTEASPVPIPAALPLLATGLGAMGLAGWRSKRNAAKSN